MQQMILSLPDSVTFLISRLNQAGFSAYAVGGCIRDSFLGLVPHDWDICTSALPNQIQAVFSDQHLVNTGFKHGTVTVVLDHVPFEITTFRVDGTYTDHRHPDGVTFVHDIRGDLARRDFTINAMAYSVRDGLVDIFEGRQDLVHRIIRCVGDPARRFEEDALRILRALRFASVYDFSIEAQTDASLRQLGSTLKHVAAERLREELIKLLCGPGVGRILRIYPHILAVIIPEIAPMIGYDQNNHHHLYDLWEHTVRAVENVPPDPILRVTMLLHDIGKPSVKVSDENGESHFPGHQIASVHIAQTILDRLRFDHAARDRILLLIENHDIPLRNAQGEINIDRRFLLRRLHRFGEDNLRALFLIHRADRTATGYSTPDREMIRYQERESALDQLMATHPCFQLKDLAVNGKDLLAVGLHGREVGISLQRLLEAVMNQEIPNQREALLAFLSSFQ